MNILDFGAVGDGKTLCTKSFCKAVEAAKAAGVTLRDVRALPFDGREQRIVIE